MLSKIRSGLSSKKSSKSSISGDDPGEARQMLKWVYQGDTEPPDYHEMYFMSNPSAPPAYSPKRYKPQSAKIVASVEILTRTPIENMNNLINIVETLIDHYDGPILIKPWVITSFLIVVTHMIKEPPKLGVKTSTHKYHNGFSENLKILIHEDFLPDTVAYTYSKNIQTQYRGNPCNLSVTIKIEPTARMGRSVPPIYHLKMPDNRPIPDIADLLRPHGLEGKIIRGELCLTHKSVEDLDEGIEV
ncbi:matrix protein M [Coastal Plains virus]|uniref:Matrix protein n=1 Tax=Coastal Plains virus TaxID=764599 RepID=D8V082_9RHAB|nr:matrix protein M [Coastal Plains virus]ADG86359.1 matrix protein M [Coastal Plains virus]